MARRPEKGEAMLVLDHAATRAALPITEAIALMAEALKGYSSATSSQPLRTILRPAGRDDLLGTMPAFVAGPDGGYGLKAMMLKPGNPARGLDLHIGVVLVFDPDTGAPLAMADAGAVTAIRTPAVSAVATDLLAAPGAGDLAILGSGVQARGHLEAMAAVRTLRSVRVWSRTPAHAQHYRDWAAQTLGIEVSLVPSAHAALDGADLVCSTMAGREPVVQAADLARGAHVNAVGASFADHREYSSEAVARCRVFVDSRESAGRESLDLLAPQREGLVGPDHVLAEIGEVLLDKYPGRQAPDEITFFKSLGLAVEDVIAGFAIARTARLNGLGITVELK
jgi:alanine dehydrogenase